MSTWAPKRQNKKGSRTAVSIILLNSTKSRIKSDADSKKTSRLAQATPLLLAENHAVLIFRGMAMEAWEMAAMEEMMRMAMPP